VDLRLRSARLQKPAVKFVGFPWPRGASADAAGALKGFSRDGKLDSAIDDIEKTKADTIYGDIAPMGRVPSASSPPAVECIGFPWRKGATGNPSRANAARPARRPRNAAGKIAVQ